VLSVKDIAVGKFSVRDYGKLSFGYFLVYFRGEERDRWGFRADFNEGNVGTKLGTWEDYTGTESCVWMTCVFAVNKLWLLPLLNDIYSDIALDVKGHGFPGIHQVERDQDWFAIRKKDVILGNAYPCSLIQPELLNSRVESLLRLSSIVSSLTDGEICRIRRINHFAILEVNENGISKDGEERTPLHEQRVPMAFSVIAGFGCALMNFYAFWQTRFSGHFWRYVLLFVLSFIGLCYCMCVFLHIVAKGSESIFN
jgi:hypothetical protein